MPTVYTQKGMHTHKLVKMVSPLEFPSSDICFPPKELRMRRRVWESGGGASEMRPNEKSGSARSASHRLRAKGMGGLQLAACAGGANDMLMQSLLARLPGDARRGVCCGGVGAARDA